MELTRNQIKEEPVYERMIELLKWIPATISRIIITFVKAFIVKTKKK
jgi:hypothetical protein